MIKITKQSNGNFTFILYFYNKVDEKMQTAFALTGLTKKYLAAYLKKLKYTFDEVLSLLAALESANYVVISNKELKYIG